MMFSRCKLLILGAVTLLSVASNLLHAEEINFAAVPEKVAPGVFAKAEKKFGITGSFIQIWNSHLAFTKEQWGRELRALHSLGNKTLIVQYSAMNEYEFVPKNEGDPDPIATILDYADENGIQVFLGGHFDSRWITGYTDIAVLSDLVKKNEVLAARMGKLYEKHKSFVGWYVPFETSDWDFADLSIFFTDVYNQRFFLSELAQNFRKAIPGREMKVAASAYFLGKQTTSYLEYSYRELLKDTGIDILMVQDGAGVRHWRDYSTQVEPYLKAFKYACDANGIELWTIAESFEMKELVKGFSKGGLTTTMGLEFSPTNLERLKKQVAAAKPYSKNIVQFDGFHYMSPFHGEARKRLYRDVRKLIESTE